MKWIKKQLGCNKRSDDIVKMCFGQPKKNTISNQSSYKMPLDLNMQCSSISHRISLKTYEPIDYTHEWSTNDPTSQSSLFGFLRPRPGQFLKSLKSKRTGPGQFFEFLNFQIPRPNYYKRKQICTHPTPVQINPFGRVRATSLVQFTTSKQEPVLIFVIGTGTRFLVFKNQI